MRCENVVGDPACPATWAAVASVSCKRVSGTACCKRRRSAGRCPRLDHCDKSSTAEKCPTTGAKPFTSEFRVSCRTTRCVYTTGTAAIRVCDDSQARTTHRQWSDASCAHRTGDTSAVRPSPWRGAGRVLLRGCISRVRCSQPQGYWGRNTNVSGPIEGASIAIILKVCPGWPRGCVVWAE